MAETKLKEGAAAPRFEGPPGQEAGALEALAALRGDFASALRQDATLAERYPALAVLVGARER